MAMILLEDNKGIISVIVLCHRPMQAMLLEESRLKDDNLIFSNSSTALSNHNRPQAKLAEEMLHDALLRCQWMDKVLRIVLKSNDSIR
jgi:hypothetical protein